jgi:hypothetical protein
MKISANDWASPDPNKNMSLAEADSFANRLTSALMLQMVGRFVKTTGGNTISEHELRHNQFLSPLPVNLYTQLASAGDAEFNIAGLRSALHDIAQSDDPVAGYIAFLRSTFPTRDPFAIVAAMPLVAEAVAGALAAIG